MKNQGFKRPSSDPKDRIPVEQNKRGKGSSPMPPSSNVWVCMNPACRATQSTGLNFCKRCSCCICHQFDDNKDPSLWLECTPDSGSEGSCGFSCHIECALQCGKVGVHSRQMQLDGSYCCASCGKVSSIIGCWKKQLKIAMDAHRVDVLCYRIFLSYRILEEDSVPSPKPQDKTRRDIRSASRFKVRDTQMTPTVVLDKGKEFLESCSGACTEKCDGVSDVQPKTLPQERLPLPDLPDLNEELRESDTTNRPLFINSSGSRGLDDDFENIVKIIRGLEHGGHVSEEFRLKFLTWFGLRSSEHERRVVRAFVKTMIDDPSGLAEQLINTFSDIIFSTRR